MFDHETGVFTMDHNQKLDSSLIDYIGELCTANRLETVADLGCSRGRYCAYLTTKYNLICTGYEGNVIAIKNSIFDNIIQIDLTNPTLKDHLLERGLTYDLVLCLEVGEHIPKQKCDVFLDNVVSFSKDFIIMSWASPERKSNQVGHVNELTNEKVFELMEKRGFCNVPEMTEELKRNASVRWFKTNTMFFRRK